MGFGKWETIFQKKLFVKRNLAKLSNLIVNGWVWEPKKDVASCVKHGGPASRG